MKSTAVPTSDPAVLAVLHRAGRSWRGLIANSKGGKPAIVTSREFPAEHVDRIDGWLTEQQAGTVLCVLPAAHVICRTTPLPDAPAEQLEPALRLQAEAHLLGIAPPHRVVMAVLPSAAGEATRSGLIFAWPEAAEFRAPVSSRPVHYVPDVACLAALLNGRRPDQPLMWLDRADGSVAIALTQAGGATFRATREESDNADTWQKSIGRIVAETALNAGHAGAFVEQLVQTARAAAAAVGAHGAALALPDEIRESARARVADVEDSERWWEDYGVAAGALLAETGALAPLTRLQHTPPIEAPSRIRNVLEACSRPRTAALVVVGSLLLLMFAPLTFSALRLMALKVRYGDVAEQLTIAREARNQIAVYRELEKQQVWPMTKLLSDIATNAPLGIELDVMRLDAGKEFAVSGTAIAKDGKTPAEIVAQMSANLRSEGLFNNISLSIGDANNLGVYQFDITGKVNAPFRTARYPAERDFLAWDAVARRDGKPAPASGKPATTSQPDDAALAGAASGAAAATGSRTSPPIDASTDAGANAGADDGGGEIEIVSAEGAGDDDADASIATNGSGRRTTSLSNSAVGANQADVGSDGPPAGQIPPPVSKEEIEAMSQAELQQALARVSKARPYAKSDKALDDRLRDEFNMILAQLRKVKGGA